MRVETALVNAVKEGKKAVVVLLSDRVIFMVVAPGALNRQTEERCAGSMDAVSDVLNAIFLFNTSSLVGLAVVTVKSCCETLFSGRVREQVTGKLPRNKLVIG